MYPDLAATQATDPKQWTLPCPGFGIETFETVSHSRLPCHSELWPEWPLILVGGSKS